MRQALGFDKERPERPWGWSGKGEEHPVYEAAHLIHLPAPGSEANMKPPTKRALLWSQHRHTRAASRGSQEAEGWLSLPLWPPGSRQAERVLRPGWPAGGPNRKHNPATQPLLFESLFNAGKSLWSLFHASTRLLGACPSNLGAASLTLSLFTTSV